MRFMKSATIVALTAAIILFTICSSIFGIYAISNGVGEDNGLVSGIVRENNPSLGYLTLYFRDGSGADPQAFDSLTQLRTYTYGYEIPVTRDGIAVTADSIQPGDQVFLKLDEEGTIAQLSAASFYDPVYGTVHLKSNTGLIIKKDNGIYSHYPIKATTLIYKNGKPGTLSDINAGEKVKLLVQINGSNIDLASIDIEKNPKPVEGVLRGNIEFFDTIRDSLVLSRVQEFVNGRWVNSAIMGVESFGFSSDYKTRPMKRISGKAYLAIKKAPDGTKKIASAAYRAGQPFETIINDRLLNLSGGLLGFENSSDIIKVDNSTIVIKDGKLVDITAIDTLDPVKASLEKSLYENSYSANVLICESTAKKGFELYRGRIKNVDTAESITLETFAVLNGITWDFINTPKTFDIDLSITRFFDNDGIGNMREFDESYIGKSIYIVAEGSKINLISTAPYAENPVSGRIKSFTGGVLDDSGSALTDLTGLKLTEAFTYNNRTKIWNKSLDLDIDIPENAVVIKKEQSGSISLLKPGDQIKIIRHAQSQNGILILCD